jgi:hypothetical protein
MRASVQPTGAKLLEDNGMKKVLEAVAAAALLAAASTASATPSTVVWTPATTYTQPFLVPHITYDTYLGERTFLPVDVGLTIGFVPPNKYVEGEVGVDAFYPILPDVNGVRETSYAFQFNGKLTLKEGALAAWSPGLSVGIMNVGLEEDYNDYNLVHATLGKTIGAFGTVSVGAYLGNDRLFVDETGDEDEMGFMASYASPKLAVGLPGLKDVAFGADIATGENWFSAAAAALTFYFTDSVSLLTGPVWFLNEDLAQGLYSFPGTPGTGSQFAWTVQLDVDLPFK